MSKSLAQQYLKNGDKIETIVIFDDNKKFELKIKGEHKAMSNNNGFSKKQLEQLGQLMDNKLQPIVQEIKEVKYRLDVLESFHKSDIKKIKSKKEK